MREVVKGKKGKDMEMFFPAFSLDTKQGYRVSAHGDWPSLLQRGVSIISFIHSQIPQHAVTIEVNAGELDELIKGLQTLRKEMKP